MAARVEPSPSPARMFADGRFFTPDAQGALRRSARGAEPHDRAGLPADAQHRPRARSLAHHDAHRQERSACRSIAPNRSSRSTRMTPRAITSAMPTSCACRPASAPSSCARWSRRASSPARSSCRCTGTISSHPARASTCWSAPSPIRSPGSRPRRMIPARVERFVAATYGFAVLRRKPANIRRRVLGHCQVQRRLARRDGICRRAGRLGPLVTAAGRWRRTELVAYHDAADGAVIASPATRTTGSPAPSFSRPSRSPSRVTGPSRSSARRTCARGKRTSAIAGRPGKGGIDRGATVCACFGVGANEIAAAVGARLHDGVGHRRSAAGRHQLRLLPRRNPQHHRSATRAAAVRRPAHARRVGLRDATMHGHLQSLSVLDT